MMFERSIALRRTLPYTVLAIRSTCRRWSDDDQQRAIASERFRSLPTCNLMARLVSVNVGLPRDVAWKGRTVHTAIWKDPVRGRCRAGRLNLQGDKQGDLGG